MAVLREAVCHVNRPGVALVGRVEALEVEGGRKGNGEQSKDEAKNL